MPDELTPETIAEAATQPASASVDGRSAAAVSIGDQIAAHKYAAAQAALAGTNASGGPKTGWNKLRTARAKPPSAV
jgi:hypothetical protein